MNNNYHNHKILMVLCDCRSASLPRPPPRMSSELSSSRGEWSFLDLKFEIRKKNKEYCFEVRKPLAFACFNVTLLPFRQTYCHKTHCVSHYAVFLAICRAVSLQHKLSENLLRLV